MKPIPHTDRSSGMLTSWHSDFSAQAGDLPFFFYIIIAILYSGLAHGPSQPCCRFSHSLSSFLLSPSLRTVASLALHLVPRLLDILATLHSASFHIAIAPAQALLVGSVLYVPRPNPAYVLVLVPLSEKKILAPLTPLLSSVLTFLPGSLRSLNLLSTRRTMLFNPTPSLPSTSFLLNVQIRMAVRPKSLIIPRWATQITRSSQTGSLLVTRSLTIRKLPCSTVRAFLTT